MNKLIAGVIKNRKVTLFLTAIVAIAGLYAYYLLPRQESPDVSVPVAMVITPYPGASPGDVKDLVTQKIEEKLEELDGYDYSKGIAKESVSVVLIWFNSSTNYDKAMQDVRNAVADVQKDLPQGALASEVNTDMIESSGIIISLSGETYSYDQLDSFGEMFKDRLRDVSGISKVKVVGKIDKEVKVKVNVARLNELGLSMEELSKVLAAQNIQIPSGNLKYAGTRITVSIPGNYSSLEDIKNTIISVSKASGTVTKIRDIAEVSMEPEEGTQKFKENGRNAVLLTGYFETNKNIVIIGKDARKGIDEVKSKLPSGLMVNEVIYQPDTVSHATDEFMLHLLIGILLVIFVVFLSMGVRNALVVSTAIPLSILMAFTAMYIKGVPIHQISLSALIIALGILVDDSIVVCDNIQVRLDEGNSLQEAAHKGATRCTVPNFAATFCIMLAFSPLLFVPGAPGQFIYAIPWVIIVAVSASYLISMFVIPSMMAYFAGTEKKHQKKESVLRLFFRKALEIALKRKKTTVAGMFLLTVLVVGAFLPQLKFQFFPYLDKDSFYIEINSEKPGDIDATESLTDRVEALLQKEPEVTDCTVSIGNGMPKFYITMAPPKPAEDYGQMIVKFDLKKTEKYKTSTEFASHIQALLNRNIPSGKCKVKLLEYAEPKDAKIILRLTGEDLTRLIRVSEALQGEIAKLPGTSDVRDNWNDGTLQMEVRLDEQKASNLGITKYDVQKEINLALYGYKASIYRKDGREYGIKVQGDMEEVSLLENFKIKSGITGNKIPLKEFATIGYGTRLDTLHTYRGEQAIDILADSLPGYDATRLENRIETEILSGVDTSGAKVSFAGEREDIKKNFTALGIMAVVAILAIYVVMMIQFGSFVQPLVILTTVPLSLIGSVMGLYGFNQPMSFTALLGIIALIGLVVKNGILLIDFINEARASGSSIEDACLEAVDKRFNAVILSATTIILALIPLAVSGSNLFSPMAIALMFGLTVATFLTMVVVPVIYSMIEARMEKRKRVSPASKNMNNGSIHL